MACGSNLVISVNTKKIVTIIQEIIIVTIFLVLTSLFLYYYPITE